MCHSHGEVWETINMAANLAVEKVRPFESKKRWFSTLIRILQRIWSLRSKRKTKHCSFKFFWGFKKMLDDIMNQSCDLIPVVDGVHFAQAQVRKADWTKDTLNTPRACQLFVTRNHSLVERTVSKGNSKSMQSKELFTCSSGQQHWFHMVPFFHTPFTPFSHDFHRHSPSSDYNTRTKLNLRLPSVKRNWGKQRAAFHAIKDFNSLSQAIRQSVNLNIFNIIFLNL